MRLFAPKNQNGAQRGRWVLAGGVLIQLFCGIPAAWGAFQQGVEQGYQLDTSAVTMVFSLVIAAFGVGCVAGGALQDHLGARWACVLGGIGLGGGFFAGSFLPQEKAWCLYLAFSLPVGLGCALLYPAVMSCAQKWYPEKKGLATGIIGGAVGLSGAVLTFSARWLTATWDIRVCFRVLGIVMTTVCLLGAWAMAPPPTAALKEKNGEKKCVSSKTPQLEKMQASAKPQAENQTQKGANGKKAKPQPTATDVPPSKVVRTLDYWLLLAAVAGAAPTVLLFSPVILQLGQQRGLAENTAALAIVVGSLTSAAGRLAMPWLSDRIGRRAADLILLGALTGFSVVFAFVQQVWVIVLYACLTFCYSGQAALLPAFASDRFGSRWAGVNYGMLALGMSAGSVAFPLLARTLSGQSTPHWIAAAAAAAGFVCLLFYGRKSAGKS